MVLSGRAERRIAIGIAAVALIASLALAGSWRDWFSTREGRASRALARGDFGAAARDAVDVYTLGYARFRLGDFEGAAAAFARIDTAAAALGRGNAQVMLGRYEQAIADYERALELRPEWEDAATNLGIARARAELVALEGGDMTGGQLGADEVVFDPDAQRGEAGSDETTDGGAGVGDVELRALWLLRMKTSPADFLRARFAWQHAQQEEGPR